jgi:hypothetical protein
VGGNNIFQITPQFWKGEYKSGEAWIGYEIQNTFFHPGRIER